MVKNMANVVKEYNINQGDIQLIMGLLANIESLGEIKPMDMDQIIIYIQIINNN